DERACRAVPDDSPTHRPPMPTAHLSAIHQIDATLGHTDIVHEQSCGPTLMRLDAPVPSKDAIQDNIRSLVTCSRNHIHQIVTNRDTPEDEEVRSRKSKISRFG